MITMKRKKVFVDIYSVDNVSDEQIYDYLHKNIPNSYIKLHIVKEFSYGDV